MNTRSRPSRRGLNRSALAGLFGGLLIFSACTSETEAVAAPPPPPVPVPGVRAFPGAVGFGAAARGGRGGAVMIVNSLADSGPGTLRACIQAAVPRVCVFQVAGVIRFATPAHVRNPYLTIAGQTAPGGGITLAHAGGLRGRTPLVIKGTSDIVVRHIRIRTDLVGGNREGEDGITIENSNNVIIDHVSVTWARDELINGYGDNDRITVSNSIFAEGIPRHDKCALLASDPIDAQRFSFINNLCAHNGDRNPDVKFPAGSCVEVVNNIFYNAQSQFTEVWENFGPTPVSVVGNTYRAGPNTNTNTTGIARNTLGSLGQALIYLWDNQFQGNFIPVAPEVQPAIVGQPPCPLTVPAVPAATAFNVVLRSAGALPRDIVDLRLVQETAAQRGALVFGPGIIPPIARGTPYPDVDRDGMDDRWEPNNGAIVGTADPWADGDRDGAPNLDEFLDYAHRRLMAAI